MMTLESFMTLWVFIICMQSLFFAMIWKSSNWLNVFIKFFFVMNTMVSVSILVVRLGFVAIV